MELLAQDDHTARAETTAVYAERAGLPRILPKSKVPRPYHNTPILGPSDNAAQYPPPSLNNFRTTASREPADAPPVLWYWQMTGEEWNRETHSYQVCFLDPDHNVCINVPAC